MRTLTEAEVARVRRWARRQHLALLLLSPLAALAAVGLVAMGASFLTGRAWGSGVLAIAAGGGLALAFGLVWRSATTYRHVTIATPVATLCGVLRLRSHGKTSTYLVGDRAVVFASRALRRAVPLDAACIADVILEAPALVIAIRPATR